MDAEELDKEDEYVGGEEVEEVVPPEYTCIWMPSRLKLGRGKDLGLGHLVEEELQLQRGQANDSLANANSVRSKTRAQKAIADARKKAFRHACSYCRARKAMQYLGAPEDLLDNYKDISSTNLSVNKDVTEEN
ncbi:hypothetical protein PAXRUDRAFT_21453 [Paxillus rubicundulus Ve08.2h10]|uniref:Uncharacterized protein n=1 Tax=Paxillus rubicundulus Ve08.2h10 TaxID=930991 RepID=A0A0D0D7H8_9AGAM|nr:hypothetical protein PAXRUDRAFT_21453 [Paxillus rubicundulus Ve08.2h10]